MDTFRLLTLENVYHVPVSITPSISPIYGNNPALKVYEYNESDLTLVDFTTYFYPVMLHRIWQK